MVPSASGGYCRAEEIAPGVKREAGSMTDPGLNIEVHDADIIITMPGTSFKATYRRQDKGIDLNDVMRSDLSAPISLREFIARADEAANDKARELGWIV